MKKTLILIIGIIILVLTIFAVIRGVKIGNKASIYSFMQVKVASENLDAKLEEANTETKINYPQNVKKVETAIKDLTQTKEEYETKVEAALSNPELGITQIEKYKIEYLWDKLGSYAKDESLNIKLDFEETTIKGTYNIKFTLLGSYVGITDFLYNIENDDDLNYKVKNFKITPTTTTTKSDNKTNTNNNANNNTNTTSGNTKTVVDTSKLTATFVVENIIINFS